MERTPLTESEINSLVTEGATQALATGKRVLVIIPDTSRSAPIPQAFSAINRLAVEKHCHVDFLIALGTHPQLTDSEIESLVGMPLKQVAKDFPGVHIWNHHWEDRHQLVEIGKLSSSEVDVLSSGLINDEIPIRINKLALEYDHILICGPVFPHELAGFSGGAKYFFPGIAGEEVINRTHWIGALATAMLTIGIKDTPMRRIINRAAEFIKTPVTYIAFGMLGHDTLGIFSGELESTWSKAVELSSEINIKTVPKPYKSVLSMPSSMYTEIWTAGKAMYKLESVVEDGGELIIYAPWVKEFSITHNDTIMAVGYHVRDYLTSQWDRFSDYPKAALAHSTHVKGTGKFINGCEIPRINVFLATGIPEEICRKVNIGYRNPAEINPDDWKNAEAQGRLFVPNAGEILYRLSD
jgi:lactate racemase